MAIAAIFPLLVLSLWHLSGSNYVIDDAFISFRYAEHLASGLGLTWNLGEPPTQGFSNPLFVAFIAVFIRIGVPALVAAHVLNAIGLSLTCVIVYEFGVHQLQSRWAALLPALAVATFPDSLRNAMSGLETVFWTGLLFAIAATVARHVHSRSGLHPGPLLVLATLACLTRAESAGLTVLWLTWILVCLPQQARPRLYRWSLAFAAVGVGYLLWCRWYFGDALPNSYYVKVNDPWSLPGTTYGIAYAWRMAGALLCAALCYWPGRRGLAESRELSSYAVLFGLVVIFLFVNPIVGTYYRFFYPTTCLIVALGVVGTIRWSRAMRDGRGPGKTLSQPLRSVVVGLPCVLAVVVFCIQPVRVAVAQCMRPTRNQPFETELRVARSLSEISAIADAVIAINDAGIIPFVTRARVIDYVGLNDSRIAREGWRRGPRWVMAEVLSDAPDLFATYTHPDGQVLIGDGVLGPYRAELLSSEAFKRRYVYLGGCDLGEVHQQWFVRRDSRFGVPVRAALSKLVDVHSYREH